MKETFIVIFLFTFTSVPSYIFAEEIVYHNAERDTFDVFEIIVETDKKKYYENEIIHIRTTLKNPAQDFITFSANGCGPSLTIDHYRYHQLNQNYEIVLCPAVERKITMEPNESRIWKFDWNQLVSDDLRSWHKIGEGNHTIKDGFDNNLVLLQIEILSSSAPRKQIANGILPENIICKFGFDLVFKSSNGKPVCIKHSTVEKLAERGWTTYDFSKFAYKFLDPHYPYQKFLDDLERGGTSIIIGINTEFVPEGYRTLEDIKEQRERIASLQDQLLESIVLNDGATFHKLKYAPGMSFIDIDKSTFYSIVSSPLVKYVAYNTVASISE